jgi:hypothetical protein
MRDERAIDFSELIAIREDTTEVAAPLLLPLRRP